MHRANDMLRLLNQMTFSLVLIGYQQCAPDWRRQRKHRFYSLWLITKGAGEFTMNGNVYRAEPGKLFALVPGMDFVGYTVDGQPLEYYFVRFNYAVAVEEKERWHFEQPTPSKFPLEGMYVLQNPPATINLFEQLHHLWQRRGQSVTMRRKILFQELLLTICQDLRAQEVAGNTTLAIERTIDYMVTHYKQRLTLDTLAHIAGLSSSHYSRLFKKYTGYSPIDYVTHLRMDRAKELLMLSDYKLRAVARSVGYQDEFYFSRIFKKVVGMSPSHFANEHHNRPLETDT